MIIDSFTFFNELDILEIRLKELYNVIDYFVLVESPQAYSGVKKPLFFEENKKRFSKYLDKIVHVKLDGLPPLISDTELNRFWLQHYQRNQILGGLIRLDLSQNDIVMISDVDEIPHKKVIEKIDNIISYDKVLVFKQLLLPYYLEGEPEYDDVEWLGTTAFRYQMCGKYLPQDLRTIIVNAGRIYNQSYANEKTVFVDNAGWHLTYFGGTTCYHYKTSNFSAGANGANGYKDPKTVEPVTISRENQTKKLKEYNNDLKKELMNIIEERKSNFPEIIINELENYYHLFKKSYY
jgi:beta-1,4-mannosyl-glycoprotein beta-1,4-N-acetylglucosaminyltransferase